MSVLASKMITIVFAQDGQEEQSRLRTRQVYQRHAALQRWGLPYHCIQGLHCKTL